MKNVWHYKYPVGRIGIAEADGCIVSVFFASAIAAKNEATGKAAVASGLKPAEPRKKNPCADFEQRESALIKKVAKQLDEYFAGERHEFELPLAFCGTEFQKRVWEILLTIPYGETRTYGEIAVLAGNPKAARAVGLANNRNPIVIICPCHRVIGKDGSLTGFGGGLPAKELLLDLEAGLL